MKSEILQSLKAGILALEEASQLEDADFGRLGLELPRDPSHGDLASNAAMIFSKKLGLSPRDLAAHLAEHCNRDLSGRATVEVAGPGFLNFRLAMGEVQGILHTILKAGAEFGRSDAGRGQKINLEFVSANPTGPPVVVSARAAAFGSTLSNIFRFAGYESTSEYYLNDAGKQVLKLGASLLARWKEGKGEALEIPENGYHGIYLKDLAAELDSAMVSQWQSLPEEECHAAFAGWAIVRIGEQIRTQMEGFRSPFDVWFSERTLHEGGHLDSARDFLVSQKLCYEEEGALWFRSSDFGDDKDRVIQRSDGTPTYFLADVAYAIDKRDRGFSKAIYVLGPDHHGYVARLKAIAEAIGKGSDWIEVILLQWVTLMEGGEAVSMSKRAGEFVTMEDLIREVGVDVARCYFLTRRAESHLDFDLDLAREQSSKSPVFYAQYATARISGLLRKAAEAGFSGEEEVELQRLNCEEELALIRALERFPEILASSAEAREPNRLFSYLSDVSTLFHRFYHEHQIVSEDRELSVARLALSRASRQVLANGLSLMGVDAPERM